MYRQHPLREIRANITSHVSKTSTLPRGSTCSPTAIIVILLFHLVSECPDYSKVPRSLSVLQSISAVCWWEALRKKCNQGQRMDHVEKLGECFSATRLLSPAAAHTARRRMWFHRHIPTPPPPPLPRWLITTQSAAAGETSVSQGERDLEGGKLEELLG